MSLTLNIIAHECAQLGQVVRGLDANPSFQRVRYFLPGKPASADILYVCESAEDARAVTEAGFCAVYVGAEDAPAAHAALSVLGGEPALAVLDALLDAFHRYGEWERQMDALFYRQGTLQDLIDASESFVLNHINVLDPALKLLAYTRNIPCDDPITVELIEHGYHTEENIRKFKLHKRFKPWSENEGFVINDTYTICKYVTVAKSVKTRSAFSTITVMSCNMADPEPWLLDVFQMLTNRIELFAKRDYPDDKPAGDAVDTFLKDLVSGAIENEAAIEERSRYAGIPHDGRFCLFYMEAETDSVPISRLVADVTMAVAPAKTILVDGGVAVLCFNCVSDSCALHCMAGACPTGKRTVSQRINQLMERRDLSCGRSSKFTLLSDAPRAFKQAREAYSIGRRLKGRQAMAEAPNAWSRIFSFDAYGIDYLAGNFTDEELSLLGMTYVAAVLSTLARQDEEARTNNYEFLYAYLLYERRVTVVAEKLHMHRNNVNYRISRIEEQFGINTDDPALRQDLLVAYRVRDAALRRIAQ